MLTYDKVDVFREGHKIVFKKGCNLKAKRIVLFKYDVNTIPFYSNLGYHNTNKLLQFRLVASCKAIKTSPDLTVNARFQAI